MDRSLLFYNLDSQSPTQRVGSGESRPRLFVETFSIDISFEETTFMVKTEKYVSASTLSSNPRLTIHAFPSTIHP